IVTRHLVRGPTLRTASMRGYHSSTRKLPRPRGRRHHGIAVVHGGSQVSVGKRGVLVATLRHRGLEMALVVRSQLVTGGAGINTPFTPVEALSIPRHIVDDGPVVYVRDVNRAHIHDRSIVKQSTTPPVTALETNPGVPAPVFHAAIKANMRP